MVVSEVSVRHTYPSSRLVSSPGEDPSAATQPLAFLPATRSRNELGTSYRALLYLLLVFLLHAAFADMHAIRLLVSPLLHVVVLLRLMLHRLDPVFQLFCLCALLIIQFRIVSRRTVKPIRAPPCLRSFPPTLLLKQFQRSSG